MKIAIATIPFLLLPTLLMAEHDDFEILRPNLNSEHYLDINKGEFEESMNDDWHSSDNGWRISSHSITTDLTYLHTQIKLHHQLSEYASMRLHYDQEIEYYDKELPPPGLEFEVRPYPKYPVSVSIVGSFQYDKSGSEQGGAITFGERTKNFIRYTDLTIDKYHNSKTGDASRYITNPQIHAFEGAYHWSDKLYGWFEYRQFTPLDFLFDDQVTTFDHESNYFEAFIKYKHDQDNHYKVRIKGFEIKQAQEGTVNERQQLEYESIDLRWLLRQSQPFRYAVGYRYDQFNNDIYSTLTDAGVLEYPYRSRQVYGTMTHQYHAQQSWEVGLYVGVTNEPNDFKLPDIDPPEVTETKLNFVWGYYSINKRAAAFVHISFNLDDFNEDPGDGGGLTYQSTF